MASIDKDPNLWVYEARARLYEQTRGMTPHEIGEFVRAKSAEVLRKYGNGRTADEIIAEDRQKVAACMRELEAERGAADRERQEGDGQIAASSCAGITAARVAP